MAAKDDFLASLPVNEVDSWYYRAAEQAAKEKIDGQVPLAATFLKKYLDNRKKSTIYRFHPPSYLKTLSQVNETLQYHRDVFLTKKKARLTQSDGSQEEIWAGVKPRLQGKSPYKKWDIANDPKVRIEYQSLVEVGKNPWQIAFIQLKGSKGQKDIFASLRGFQLKSIVEVTGNLVKPSVAKVHFSSWWCEIFDTYDFNFNEYLSFKNPDYGKKNDPKAVCPDRPWLKVYHSNARRLEKARLACPYKIHSHSWMVQNAGITGEAEISF